MRARTLVLFLVALTLAGGTAILVRSFLAQKNGEVEAQALARPAAAQKFVLVAKGPITRGQILKPQDFAWQVWPEGGIDKNYILNGTGAGTRNPESFAGWVARDPFAAGEPISDAKIVSPGSRGFLAAVLHPGMRAISVPVTATSGISGFIFPGDEVDILITHQLTGHDEQHRAAETVLQDVRVIGIDQKLDSKSGEPLVAHTATLEVTPKQSEMIAVAAEIGKLSLSLRSLAANQSEQSAAASPAGDAPSTFTLDSEVSQLVPKPGAGTAGVTVLRGGAGKAG
jgi:pilus assembly protein CpaB